MKKFAESNDHLYVWRYLMIVATTEGEHLSSICAFPRAVSRPMILPFIPTVPVNCNVTNDLD